jgi:LysM repeat protein
MKRKSNMVKNNGFLSGTGALFCAVILSSFVMASCATGQKRVSVVSVANDERAIRLEAEKIMEQNTPEKNVTAVEPERIYTVKTGDSLWKISKAVLGSGIYWEQIADANKIGPPFLLKVNMKLIIRNTFPEADTSGRAKAAPATEEVKPVFSYRTIPNKAFGVGERLVFAVKYFNVTAGYGILDVKGIEDLNGRKAYHIEATARTAPFFETFYRVKDVLTSYMDMYGLFSLKYSKHLEEGGYRNDTYMVFNHEAGFAQKNNGEKCDIKPFAQDVLSEFYYFRSIFKGDDETKIDVASDECKSYQIVVKKVRYERIKTDAGEFDCVIVQPFLKFEGVWKQKGDVLIWLTNDKNLMPVLVRGQISIGTVDAELQSATVVKAE